MRISINPFVGWNLEVDFLGVFASAEYYSFKVPEMGNLKLSMLCSVGCAFLTVLDLKLEVGDLFFNATMMYFKNKFVTLII